MGRITNLQETGKKINEGSLVGYDSENKNIKKLQSEMEKIFNMKEKIERDLLKMESQTGKALGMAKKIKEDEYPEDTRSTGGKGNTEWALKNFAEKIEVALEALNTSIG